MKDDPDRVRAVAPAYVAYWREVDHPGYCGGPMADRSAELITFEAASVDEAWSLVDDDPFARADLFVGAWVSEWVRDRGDAMERTLGP